MIGPTALVRFRLMVVAPVTEHLIEDFVSRPALRQSFRLSAADENQVRVNSLDVACRERHFPAALRAHSRLRKYVLAFLAGVRPGFLSLAGFDVAGPVFYRYRALFQSPTVQIFSPAKLSRVVGMIQDDTVRNQQTLNREAAFRAAIYDIKDFCLPNSLLRFRQFCLEVAHRMFPGL